MHEYGIAKNIIEISGKTANGRPVAAINIVVGDSNSCVAESLAFCFDILTEDTVCAGASLNIEHIAPKLRCKECGKLFLRRPFKFSCPCGGIGEPTDIGREFYIKSIIVGG